MSEKPKRDLIPFRRFPARRGAFFGAIAGLVPVTAIMLPADLATWNEDEPGLIAVFAMMYCVFACGVFIACVFAGWLIGAIVQSSNPSRTNRDMADSSAHRS